MKSTLSQAIHHAPFTIGALAAASGLPASTIRYWESIGVLPAPARQSGQRRYKGETLARIAILRLAQSCGFGLEEMRQLVQGFRGGTPSERWRSQAAAKHAELGARIRHLQSMRKLLTRLAQCECIDWEQCATMIPSAKTEPSA